MQTNQDVPPLGPKPVFMECPFCHVPSATIVRYGPTIKTHLLATLFLLLGCWPCIFVPFCIPQLNNIVHYCPMCKAAIGTYEWPKKTKMKPKTNQSPTSTTVRPALLPQKAQSKPVQTGQPPPLPKRKLS